MVTGHAGLTKYHPMELISPKGFELRHDFLHASLPVETGDNTFSFNADIGKPV